MAAAYSYLANHVFVLPAYHCKMKLLVNKAENSWIYINCQKSLSPHQVVQAQSHHSDQSLSNHKYYQAMLNYFHNIYYAHKPTISVCLAVFLLVQPWCLIQTRQKQYNNWRIILANKHKYWKAGANIQ